MTPELRLVVALVAHGNAQLRGAPCACDWQNIEGAAAEGVSDWRARLSDPAIRRFWAAHFQSDTGPGRWAIEIEGADGGEVWLAQFDEGRHLLDKLFFNVPELSRQFSLRDAEARLHNEAQAHPSAMGRLDTAHPDDPEAPHLLPDRGLSADAMRVGNAAIRILLSLPPDESTARLRGAALGALLAAIHSS